MFWRKKSKAKPTNTAIAESGHEASKPLQDDPRWKDWPETLDVNDEADVEWIKQSRDPLVWHDAALACLIYRADTSELLPWLAQQALLDRVTAAAMFLHGSNGVRFLEEGRVQAVRLYPNADENLIEMLKHLIRLDPERTLVDNGIGLPDGWEESRPEVLERLADNPLTPRNFLGRPINLQTVRMPYYDLGEGDLMSTPYLRREMPFIFG